ncbi:hypothetical protein L210DRAFT_3367619, partial [Boletus edulis BED1]
LARNSLKKLIEFWPHRLYLIVDEKSMLSRKFFARLSAALSKAKNLADFHQFPPVKGGPLYWLMDPSKDGAEELLGRSLYEQFQVAVRLTQQVHVVDTEWHDLLQHTRHGSCRIRHINMLRSLIITNPNCPATDFTSPPRNNAVHSTPRHSVRRQWNTAMGFERCRQNGRQMFTVPALDTIGGQGLTLRERFAVATKTSNRAEKAEEHGGLPDAVLLSIGMKVVITFNVETDLDVAIGARGEVVKVVLHEDEPFFSPPKSVVELQRPPAYVIVKMMSTK